MALLHVGGQFRLTIKCRITKRTLKLAINIAFRMGAFMWPHIIAVGKSPATHRACIRLFLCMRFHVSIEIFRFDECHWTVGTLFGAYIQMVFHVNAERHTAKELFAAQVTHELT